SGTCTPQPANAPLGGEATYHGSIVFTNLDRSLVRGVLPSGLQLASNSAAPGVHPVIFLYGHQTNTCWFIGNTTIRNGPDYQELTLLVPFVRIGAGMNWHNYVVRMYLNDWFAIDIGNQWFAYAKEYGTSQESGTDVWELVANVPYFHANIPTTGSW